MKKSGLLAKTVLLPMLLLLLFLHSCSFKKIEDFNVVLVVIDTLRSDHLPFYGYQKNTAPFITELAKESIVFQNVFSASSWTSPATASIFTSLYPFQHGVLLGLLAILNANAVDPSVKVNRIPEEIETLTEVMKKNGFRTYGISDNLNIGDKQGFTQGFDRFETYNNLGAQKVNETLKNWKTEIAQKGKYFLYLHYMDPHAPYEEREPLFEPHPDKRMTNISAYDSEIHFVDRHIREVFDLFDWKQSTLLIITSDHGEGLWDHGTMGHGFTLYREEIQVPLVVYLPGEKMHKDIPLAVSTLDILPFIRDMAGFPDSREDEGFSLAPLIRGEKNDFEKRFIFSYLWKLGEEKGRDIEYKSAIFKRLHFVLKSPDQRELFDLVNDRGEKSNRFWRGQKSGRYLESTFNVFFRKCRKFNPQSIFYKLNKEKIEKLKTLGYIK